MFLNSFNHFRGMAICLIVVSHTRAIAGWEATQETSLNAFISNLLLSGTALFVFISGFLFHHIYFSRFAYKKFLTKKINYVLSPYLVWSVPAIIYMLFCKEGAPHEMFNLEGLQAIGFYIITGKSLVPFWYLPFILLVFLLSPLLVAYIKLNTGMRLSIASILFLAALFIHRPVENINTLQSFAYFLPVFLIGINCSVHKEALYKALDGKEPWLLGGVLLFALLQTLLTDTVGNFHKPFFEYGGVDTMLIQKILLCLLLFVFLHRFESGRKSKILTVLADYSFPIFFIHFFILTALGKLLDKLSISVHFNPGLSWALVSAAVIFLSLIIAASIRKIFPKHYRFIAG